MLHVELVSAGAALVMALVFASSAVEKTLTLASRRQRWHPVVLATPSLRRHATLWMSAALAVDAFVVAAVLARRWASVLAACVLVVYTYFGRRVHFSATNSCRCLWKGLEARTRRGFLVRNSLLLIVVAVAASAARAFDPVSSTLAGGLIVGSIALAMRIVDRPQHAQEPPTSHIAALTEHPQEV